MVGSTGSDKQWVRATEERGREKGRSGKGSYTLMPRGGVVDDI